MLKFFKKKKRYLQPVRKKPAKRRYSVAQEFTKKRTRSVKFQVSKARFRFSRLTKILAAFSLLIVIIAGGIGLTFFTTFFSIQHFQLVRKDFRADVSSISPMLESYRDRNILFISKNEIELTLYENFPQVESVQVERVFPRTLKITISTYPITARWEVKIKIRQETDDLLTEEYVEVPQKLFINKVGKMSDGTDDDNDAFLIIEQELRDNYYYIGDTVISRTHLEMILEGSRMLEELLDTNIASVRYFRNAQEVHFISENNTAFWIDFTTPFESQINKLHHVIAETDILSGEVEYFDLRIDDRIFWKSKEE